MHKNKFDIRRAQPPLAEPLHHLVHRLFLPSQNKPARVIAFIAARGGEGTTTVAQGYCAALAQETAQKIVLLDTSGITAQQAAYGVVDAVIAGRTAIDAVQTIDGGIASVTWMGNNMHRSAATKIMQEGQWQKSLLERFDSIVIDAPALQYSFDGILLAARADAAVIVVEAERTPQPVIENLRNTLSSAGATIAGVVMNKRRYYIPDPIYRRL